MLLDKMEILNYINENMELALVNKVLEIKRLLFTTKRIWFSDSIFDIENCDTVFFRECKFKNDIKGFERIAVPVMTIDLTQDLETIWNKMNRNTKRNIKKAINNNIVIKLNEKYDEFYEVYLEHIKNKKHISWYDIETKENLKKVNLFTAEYEGIVIAGLVFLENENDLLCWIASSKRYTPELKNVVGNASHLIHWEAIKYAKTKGIKEYNLSGTDFNEDSNLYSLTLYKGGFGAEKKYYYSYYKDYNIFMKIIRMSSKLIKNMK